MGRCRCVNECVWVYICVCMSVFVNMTKKVSRYLEIFLHRLVGLLPHINSCIYKLVRYRNWCTQSISNAKILIILFLLITKFLILVSIKLNSSIQFQVKVGKVKRNVTTHIWTATIDSIVSVRCRITLI